MTEEEAVHNSLRLILPGHYTRKMALYRSSKPEENHANPIHLHLLFIFGLKYFLESNNKRTTEFQTDPHNTKLEGYRHLHLQTATASSHTQHYNVIWMC